MKADDEGLQGSEVAEIHVNRFKKNKTCLCKKPTNFCVQTERSFVEENVEQEDADEIEKGDKKESSTKGSWSIRGDYMYRHHKKLRLKLYDPDSETFPILLTRLKRVLTMSLNILSMKHGPKRILSISLRSGLGLHYSRSHVQDFLKDRYKWVNERPTKIQKITRPDSIRLNLGHKKENHCRMG